MQAQLSSLITQFLQNVVPANNPSTSTIANLSPVSIVNSPHHIPITSASMYTLLQLPTTLVSAAPSQFPATFTHSQLPNVLLATTTNHPQLQLMTAHPSLQPITGIHTAHLPLTSLQPTAISGAPIPATSSTSMNITMPPILTHLRQSIMQGEFIDFSVSLHKAVFPDAMADPSKSSQRPIKPIASFAMWMEAWTLYLSVVTNHNPTRGLEILPHQYVI